MSKLFKCSSLQRIGKITVVDLGNMQIYNKFIGMLGILTKHYIVRLISSSHIITRRAMLQISEQDYLMAILDLEDL